jgi:hypothetical protein
MRVFSRRLIIAVAGCALAVAGEMPAIGSAPAAQASASSGWRLVKQFGTCGSSFGVQSVTATGAGNAWATGDFSLFFPKSGECSPVGLLIAHWDGRSWQDMRPPVGFRPAANSNSDGHAVAALSASYVWVFADREYFTPPVTQSFALLWQNGRWQAFRLADDAFLSSAVAFTHSSAWAFGYVRSSTTGRVAAYAARFNGRGWRAVPVPVLPQGTASPAPDNIWAVGPLASAANQPIPRPYALSHWTGRWHTILFPNLGLPSGEGVSRAWVVPDGAHGAWVAGDLMNNQFEEVGGVLLHWTGHGWVDVKLPFQTRGLGPLSHDGRGALWIASVPPTCCVALDMAHYNAGLWSVMPVTVPAGYDGATVTTMRLIPRTGSVWAGGYLFAGTNGDMFSAMLKYGP